MYSPPWSKEQFVSFNRAHASRLLASSKTDEHSAAIKKGGPHRERKSSVRRPIFRRVVATPNRLSTRSSSPRPFLWFRGIRSAEQMIGSEVAITRQRGLRTVRHIRAHRRSLLAFGEQPRLADRPCRRSTMRAPTGTFQFAVPRSAQRCYRKRETKESGFTKFSFSGVPDPYGAIFVSRMQYAFCRFRSLTEQQLTLLTTSTSASPKQQRHLRSRPFRSSTASIGHRHCWESIGRSPRSSFSRHQARAASISCQNRSEKSYRRTPCIRRMLPSSPVS